MRKFFAFVGILFFIVMDASPSLVLAQGKAAADPASPTGDVKCPPNVTCLTNPLNNNTVDINQIMGNILKGVLGIMGSLTLLMLVYGAFLWLTSAGNAEKVKMGTDTMLWAVIGTVLVLSSYLLLSTFLKYLTGEF